MGLFRRLWKAERGSIAVMGALSLVSMLGMTSLAVEIGSGYAAKVRNQRVADMAALGAAAAYTASGCSSMPCGAATATAGDIVVANGLASSTATVSGVTVGSASGIKVAVQTAVPIRIGRILGMGSSYNVSNAAVASLGGTSTPACVTTFENKADGVYVDGGASLTANNCSITSNSAIHSTNGSAKVTAKQITAASINDSAASYNQNAITTTPTANNIQIKSNAAVDPLTNNSSVQTALCYAAKLSGTTTTAICTSPLVTASAPVASGSTNDVTFSSGTPTAAYAAFYSNGTYNLPAGNYTFRNVTVNGGVTVNIGDGTFRADSVAMGGNGMTFGNGSITVSGTFGFNSGSTITIGNGDHNFGTLAVTGGRTLNIGSGNLTVRGAITEDGGSHIYINTSAGNTVTINGDGGSPATAINVAGGSYLCFTSNCAAATAAAGTFSATGQIATAGGSTLVLPQSQMHVISGNFNLNGSSLLGAGLYVIGGNFTNNTGGTMTGSNVSFALGGTFTLSGGTSLDLSAPPSSSSYGITDILMMTTSLLGTSIGGGSQDKYGGVIYAPNSPMTVSGGSSVSSSGSQCMMLILKSISLTGSGAVTTSNCTSQASSSTGAPGLIQ